MTETARDLQGVEQILIDPFVIGGNTAKLKVLLELHRRMSHRRHLNILDVGCVGLKPLEFWESLLDRHEFHLTGVDVYGIDHARAIVKRQGWERKVTLLEGSGYDLTSLVGTSSFDVVIATQVFEHVARLAKLLKQVTAVMAVHGEAFFTLDSAHWRSRYEWRQPIRAFKNVAKKALSLVGKEQHYDLPWYDSEVVAACELAGLAVQSCRYYNVAHLKWIHNRVLAKEAKNSFLMRWFQLEEFLNDVAPGARDAREYFACLYIHALKTS